MCVCKLLQSRPALCDPMDCSPPGSYAHEILQARLVEWIAMPSSRRSSGPRNWAHVSYFGCVGRQVLYHQRHLGSPKIQSMGLQRVSQDWAQTHKCVTFSSQKIETGKIIFFFQNTNFCAICKRCNLSVITTEQHWHLQISMRECLSIHIGQADT